MPFTGPIAVRSKLVPFGIKTAPVPGRITLSTIDITGAVDPFATLIWFAVPVTTER